METTKTIFILGDIGGYDFFSESPSTNDILKDIINNSDKDLIIKINSDGGSVRQGLDIYTALKNHPKNVTTEIIGHAYSIATIIFLGGKKRIVGKESVQPYMIHAPFIPEYTLAESYTGEELQEKVKMLKDAETQLINIYKLFLTDKTENEISDILKAETYYSADEMLANGFATELIEHKAVATYKEFLTINSNLMKNEEVEKVNSKLDLLINKVTEFFGVVKTPIILNLKVNSEEGVLIEFEDEMPKVGTKVLSDTNGTYICEISGVRYTVVITDKVVTEMTEIVEAAANPEMDALKAENEALKAENADFKAQMLEVTAKIEKFEQLVSKAPKLGANNATVTNQVTEEPNWVQERLNNLKKQ